MSGQPIGEGRLGAIGESHRALFDVVTERVRTAILNGDLYPGERLVEDRLAQQLNVSRHPVREALRTLQLEGLVEISPRRGATVSRITVEEAADLFQVLASLDGLAARLAARHRQEDDLAALRRVLEGAAQAQRTGDLEPLAGLNREFHTLVAAAGRNRHLLDILNPLRDRIQLVQAAVARRRPELSWPEHEQILRAVADQDEDRAEALAAAHIEAARNSYLQSAR